MTKSSLGLILLSIFLLYLSSNNLMAHEGHRKNPIMPAIGMVQGSVSDSSSGAPIEYASISLVNNRDGSVVTGGLSKKDGSFENFFVEDGIVEFKKNNLSILTSSIFNLADLDKTKQQDLLRTAEEEANKEEINDQSKYLADQKLEVLKSLN